MLLNIYEKRNQLFADSGTIFSYDGLTKKVENGLPNAPI